jgi:hypothetical protein
MEIKFSFSFEMKVSSEVIGLATALINLAVELLSL